MTLRLYEQEGCPYCERVATRLDELGLEYESVWVSARHSERQALKQLTGQRQVPVLVDETHVVTIPESDRILEYLTATYAETDTTQ
jgi:glutathione S-transferase